MLEYYWWQISNLDKLGTLFQTGLLIKQFSWNEVLMMVSKTTKTLTIHCLLAAVWFGKGWTNNYHRPELSRFTRKWQQMLHFSDHSYVRWHWLLRTLPNCPGCLLRGVVHCDVIATQLTEVGPSKWEFKEGNTASTLGSSADRAWVWQVWCQMRYQNLYYVAPSCHGRWLGSLKLLACSSFL